MAVTNLHEHTVQEKLNSMDMDMIDVTPVISASSNYADLDWLFAETEIPNCVASKGGSSLLQQINVWDFDGDNDAMVIDIMFFRKDPGDGINAANGASALTQSIITTYGCIGVNRITSWTSLTGDDDDDTDINFASIAPIGTILQADTDSTSVYCAGIIVTGLNGAQLTSLGDIKLQFGVVKG